MKLDLTRYGGHSENPFQRIGWCSDADIALLTDAPKLLARVVELEGMLEREASEPIILTEEQMETILKDLENSPDIMRGHILPFMPERPGYVVGHCATCKYWDSLPEIDRCARTGTEMRDTDYCSRHKEITP